MKLYLKNVITTIALGVTFGFITIFWIQYYPDLLPHEYVIFGIFLGFLFTKLSRYLTKPLSKYWNIHNDDDQEYI